MVKKTRAVHLAPEARMAAAVTETLPNLKTGNSPKMLIPMESCIHADSKATERQKPCVVMKRTDALKPACFLESDFTFRTMGGDCAS
jgi:hypothetical protein